jgi:N-acyl-D-amino-acid deacylase
MTSKPAHTFRIKERGLLKEGNFADITIFNAQTIIDKGTFTDPIQYPEGIEYVFVNGELIVEKGQHTGKLKGRVLRKK